MAADCIIFLKNQDFYDEQLLKLLMIPGISPGRLERVARAKGSVEGGERQVGILLERRIGCRAAERSSVGEHSGAAVISALPVLVCPRHPRPQACLNCLQMSLDGEWKGGREA